MASYCKQLTALCLSIFTGYRNVLGLCVGQAANDWDLTHLGVTLNQLEMAVVR